MVAPNATAVMSADAYAEKKKKKFGGSDMHGTMCEFKGCKKEAVNYCKNKVQSCDQAYCEDHLKKVHTPQGKIVACNNCKKKIKGKGANKKKERSSTDSSDDETVRSYKRMHPQDEAV